ncbi:MAG: hypothetical protein KC983_10420 [Phycisphaerales bacterium]|nr:hypothetical protein [Phycisphaerales bacterium]
MVVLSLFGSRLAYAEDTALEYFVPIATRGDYVDYCRTTHVTDDQRLILDMLFTDYASSIEALADATDAAADAAGRARVAEAFSGRRRVSTEELTALRAAVTQSYLDAMPEVDSLFDRLLGDLAGMLDESQRADAQAATRTMRRIVWSRGRSLRSETPEYGGEGVDLTAIWADFSERKECATVAGPQMAALLAQYERDVDAYLRQFARADRDDELQRRIADIKSDEDARKAAEQRLVSRWQQWFALHQKSIESIATTLASAADEATARDWRERCYEEMFPDLVTSRSAELVARWVIDNVDPTRSAQAQKILDSYQRDQSTITSAIRALHIRARNELGRVVHAMVDPASLGDGTSRKIYEELLRLTGQQSTEDARLVESMRALLSPDEREAMTKFVRKEARQARRGN